MSRRDRARIHACGQTRFQTKHANSAMAKGRFLIVILTLLATTWPSVAATSPSEGREKLQVGGQTPLKDLKDEYAVGAAEAAVMELNRQSNSLQKLVLMEIIEGTVQVRNV